MKIQEAQDRLTRIAKYIRTDTPLGSADKGFMLRALSEIASGADANRALEVHGKRGEPKGEKFRVIRTNKVLVLGWIAAVRTPVEKGGLGMTLEEACAMAAQEGLQAFGLTEDTISKYWNNTPGLRFRDMPLTSQQVDQWAESKGISGNVYEPTNEDILK